MSQSNSDTVPKSVLDDRSTQSTSFELVTETDDEQRLLETIAATELPSKIESLLETYDELVGVRDPFIWKWFYINVQPIELSCVPSEYHDTVTTAKTINMIYVTVLDDIADELGDVRLLEAARRIQSQHADASDLDHLVRGQEEAAYLEFARQAWSALEMELCDAPRANEFWPILEFDLEKMILALEYSVRLNDTVEMMNYPENLALHAQSYSHFIAAVIDMMYSPEFDRADLGQLRRVIWHGQQLHRIANWASTWERELCDGDFTSGVFAIAFENDLLRPEDLERVRDQDSNPEVIQEVLRTNDVEEQLLQRWAQKYTNVLSVAVEMETQSANLVDYVTGVRQVCQSCLIAEGYK